MRFLIHGSITPEGQAAMVRHKQALHTALELSEDSPAPVELLSSPRDLLAVLRKKQWNLFTTDTALIQQLYEQKIQFDGVIILLLDDPAVLHDQAPAVDRLFARYQRLTPRRLYTITASRVKIRQLPGAGQA